MTPKCVPSFGVDATLAKLQWDDADAGVGSPGGILEEPSSISLCTMTSRAAGRDLYFGDTLVKTIKTHSDMV